MRNRLLAGLLAGVLMLQSAGTAYAAEPGVDLSSSANTSLTEAADDGASVGMSEMNRGDGDSGSESGSEEGTDEAGSGSGTDGTPGGTSGEGSTAGGTGNSSVDGSSEASSAGSTEDAVIDGSFDEESEDGSGDASSEASSGSSEDAAAAASSDASYPDDYFDENATGYIRYDRDYEIESINDRPGGGRRRLLKSASYPDSYTTPNLPDLRDQNPYGTCWAFATIGLAEINLIKNGYTGFDLSELHLSYFAYHSVVDPLGGLTGDDVTFAGSGPLSLGGNTSLGALTLMRWTGVADEATANYTLDAQKAIGSGLDPATAYEDVVHITGYYEEKYNVNDLSPIKKMVMDYGAAGINFYAYNSISAVTSDSVYNKTYNSYYNSTKKGANHAVIIVGWDDTFSKTKFATAPPGDGAWLIRNSWTTGNSQSYSGYFWMSYYEATIDSDVCAFEAVPQVLSYDNNYQYDGGLGNGHFGVYKTANVFTASAGTEYGESIEAVSFQTTSSNVEYEINVYTELKDAEDPESGTLKATMQGTTEYSGIYEVPLSVPVVVMPGDTFSVVVALVKGDEPGHICMEYGTTLSGGGNTVTSVVSAEAGQSFVKYYDTSTNWVDYGKNGRNFRIKAFTNNRTAAETILPTGITFDKVEDGKILVGKFSSTKVNATVLPENASNKKLIWASSDPGICTVSANGILTGVNEGTATITATTILGKVAASFEAEVTTVLISLNVNGYSNITVGNTSQFTVEANPLNYELEGPVTWSIADPTVASVDSNGNVKALKPGSTVLTATADGKSGTKKIYCFVPSSYYSYEVGPDNSVKIKWKAVEGASCYRIYRQGSEIASLDVNAREYVDTGLVEVAMESAKYYNYYFAYEINGVVFKCSMTIKLYARYPITYVLGDGVQNPKNPTMYAKGLETKLYDPTPPEGLGFEGWYLESSYKTRKYVISGTDSGAITLYAKFDKSFAETIEIVAEDDQIPAGSTVTVNARVMGDNGPVSSEDGGYELTYSCKPGEDSALGAAAEIVKTAGDKPALTITGKRFGSVTVTATAKELTRDKKTIVASRTFMITEVQPEKLTITAESGGSDTAVLNVGETLRLSSAITPAEADQLVTWSSSDEMIAGITDDQSVVENGTTHRYVTVTAKAPGTAYIYAVSAADASVRMAYVVAVTESGREQDPGKELRIIDTSKNPKVYGSSRNDASVQFEKLELAAGKSFALKSQLLPAEAFESKNVSWASGNSAVATITSAGKITAKSAGSTVITLTAEDGNIVAACRITVYDPVTAFALDKKTLKLGRGNTGVVNVTTLLPASASDEVYCESSNEDVAAVSISGTVATVRAGNANGTAVLTFKTSHGEKSAKCTVTVGNPVTDIQVNAKGGATHLAAGKNLQLSAVFNDGDKASQPLDKGIVWEIESGESFARINQKGVLTGEREGYVVVKATSTSDPSVSGTIKIGIYVPVIKATLSIKNLTIAPDRTRSITVSLNFTTPNGQRPTGTEIGEEMRVRFSTSPQTGFYYHDNLDGTVTISGREYTGKTANLYAFYYPYGKDSAYVTGKVTVVDPTKGISKFALSKSKLSLDVGAVAEISGNLTPTVPMETDIVWNIDDTSLLYFVDESGNPILDEYTGKYLKEMWTGSEGVDDNKVRVMANPEASSVTGSVATVTATTLGTNARGAQLMAKCVVTVQGEAGYIQIKNGKNDVTDSTLLLGRGKSAALKADVFTDFTLLTKAGNQKVKWTSEDPSIVSVTAGGKITGVAIGTTRIWADTADDMGGTTVYEEGRSDRASSVTVTVFNPATGIKLDKSKVAMSTMVGSTTRYSSFSHFAVVTPTVSPSSYYESSKQLGDSYGKVTWTADKANIKAMAIDTARVKKYKSSAEQQNLLSVFEEEYVDISGGKSVTTGAGQSLAIMASEPGVVKLTATVAGGKKAVCTVTVHSHVTGLTIAEGRIMAGSGGLLSSGDSGVSSFDYSVTLDPASAKDKSVTAVAQLEISDVPYSTAKGTDAEKAATAAYNAVKKLAVNTGVNYRSSNTSVASVTAKGVITAKSSGTAVVTVSTADGAITKRILVVVK